MLSHFSQPLYFLERAGGVGPLSKAWEAFILPMNYARAHSLYVTINLGRPQDFLGVLVGFLCRKLNLSEKSVY